MTPAASRCQVWVFNLHVDYSKKHRCKIGLEAYVNDILDDDDDERGLVVGLPLLRALEGISIPS